jgi:hypothetical protein
VNEPFSKSATTTVSFFLPVVADDSVSASANLELLNDGQVAGGTPLDLSPAEADGRRIIAGQLPLATLPAGTYTLRVTVRSGEVADVREASFTVIP